MRNGITSNYVSSSVQNIYAEYAVILDFAPTGSETDHYVRLWTGISSGSFDDFTGTGKSYTGVGTLGNISAVSETTEVSAKNIDLILSGVPSSYISLALSGGYRGRTVAVYLQLYSSDRSTYSQSTLFRGRMDQISIQEGPETSTITVKCESRLVDLNRPRIKYYTQESQQSVYPNDNGLAFISGMGGKSIYWGSVAPATTATNGNDSGGSDGNSTME
jgi:hypothetical protein